MHLYNEINPYAVAVLRSRIKDGHLPGGYVDTRKIETIPDEDFMKYEQIHLFAGIGGFPLGLRFARIAESGLRIVTGGFPCQDISGAGLRAGITGSRSGLWREMVRCIRVVRPTLLFVENVSALLVRGMGTVLGDLAEIGYDAWGSSVYADECGVPQRRERIFIIAYPARSSPCEVLHKNTIHASGDQTGMDVQGTRTANPNDEDHRASAVPVLGDATGPEIPDRERIGTDDGIPYRLDRHHAIGNAIVPQALAEAIRRFKNG